MTLPQECAYVTGGVAFPQIREEGGVKKPEKVSLLESQTRCVTGGGIQARGLGLRGTLTAVCSPGSRPCRGPLGSPPGSQSPPEPLRGELSPEARRGRRQPTERVRQPECIPLSRLLPSLP